MDHHSITEITRRALIDQLTISGVAWSGRLPEDDFLARLYNLNELPSTDRRLRTAGEDIRQHRVNWNDWPDDWVFWDERFSLFHGDDEQFVRFLAEMLHPAVRPSAEEARRLASELNAHLAADGWELVEIGAISGRPIFHAVRLGVRNAAFPEPTGWVKVDRQVAEARSRLQSAVSEEQFQAVGLLCREALITVAQAVFDPKRYPSLDSTVSSKTDAARMLESYIAVELAGGSNEEARAHGKAALKLALALQHRRNADFRTAALCLEAAASVSNMIAILAGRRG